MFKDLWHLICVENDFQPYFLNKRINFLCEIMYQDSPFYKGCISENICVPKHLYQEFDAWYSTNHNRVPSLEVE